MALIVEKEAYSDAKRWVVVYPAYIDAKKTLQQGRKIPKGQAVDAPTIIEIHDVLVATGLNPIMERNKMYSRDQDREPESQGRVRIQLKNDDGTPKNKDFPSRQSIYRTVAEMIPKLKTRQPGYVPPPAPGASGAAKKNKKKK